MGCTHPGYPGAGLAWAGPASASALAPDPVIASASSPTSQLALVCPQAVLGGHPASATAPAPRLALAPSCPSPQGQDALEGTGPQKRLDRRLGGGGYCGLQMPLRLALAVRGTVAGRRLGALEGGGGGGGDVQYLPARGPP